MFSSVRAKQAVSPARLLGPQSQNRRRRTYGNRLPSKNGRLADISIRKPADLLEGLWRGTSKYQPHAELQLTVFVDFYRLVALSRGHLAEIVVTEVRPWIVEVGRVGHVERFAAELQVEPLRQAELPEHREVDGKQPRAVQDVAPQIAERIRRRRRERRGVEVELARSDVSEDFHRSVHVGTIDIARGVQGGIADADIQRQAALPRPQAVQLPAAQQPLGNARLRPAFALAKGQLINGALGEDVPAVPLRQAFVERQIDVVEISARGPAIEVDAFREGVRRRQQKPVGE